MARPVTCNHRISRSVSYHTANLLDLYTFFRRALNRAKYPDKHRVVAKSRTDPASDGWSFFPRKRGKGKIRNELGRRSEYDNQPSTRFRLFIGWSCTIIQFSIAEVCTRRLHAEADGVGRRTRSSRLVPPSSFFPAVSTPPVGCNLHSNRARQ